MPTWIDDMPLYLESMNKTFFLVLLLLLLLRCRRGNVIVARTLFIYFFIY